jgi:small subunit ribosomal protein S11
MTEETKDKIEEVAEISTELKSADVSDVKSAPIEKQVKTKKIKRHILKGRATVKCTYNNTIVSIADINGAILAWASSGMMGFKGAKKSTPYAATQVVASVSEKIKKYGMQELEVFVRGVGSGREASIRALSNNGFELLMIKDVTPIPHNGCRAKKPRRI